jgi:hypothetical protein
MSKSREVYTIKTYTPPADGIHTRSFLQRAAEIVFELVTASMTLHGVQRAARLELFFHPRGTVEAATALNRCICSEISTCQCGEFMIYVPALMLSVLAEALVVRSVPMMAS